MLPIKKTLLALMAVAGVVLGAGAAARSTAQPDFERIKAETFNSESEYYYPELLKKFLSSDTTMTDDQYHYFYYGAVFREDYNPYRINPYAADVKATEPLYSKAGTRSRSENTQVQKLAEKMLADNPFDLRQISYLIYSYKALGKQNLAKIWQHKFDKLIYTIARSGTGADADHAIVIVDPSNSMDYFFLSNVMVEDTEFQEPFYEVFTVRMPGASDTRRYWFDLHQILEQYYTKHPGER